MTTPQPTSDAKRAKRAKRAKGKPKVSGVQSSYSKALRGVARRIGEMVDLYDPEDYTSLSSLQTLLRRYAKALKPWAARVAASMLADVNRKDQAMWERLSGEIGAQMRFDIRKTHVGTTIRQLMQEQVDLITSLPLEASERVHKLAIEGLQGERRARDIAKMIYASQEVTKSRAVLIARTEVSRAATVLSQVRAGQAGITHYIWRTAGDGTVREGHKAMEGKVCEWAHPPAVNENGRIYYHHPGAIWNCFPGETLVTPGKVSRVIRARYSGELVRVRAAGALFEATPNHPILTTRGWVAAARIQQGDELCSMSEDAAHAVVNNHQQGQVQLREMFESGGFRPESAEGAIFDLHGDVVHEQVDVVRADWHLAADRRANFLHHLRHEVIAGADGGVIGIGVVRRCAEIFEAFSAGLGDVLLSAFLTQPRHLQAIGGTSVTRDSLALHEIVDRVLIDASLFRDRRHAEPLAAKPDYRSTLRVGEVTTRRVAGLHVFTLETVVGHYSLGPASIITKNCRCWAESIITEH